MYELILSNTSLPVMSECGQLAASEPFYHLDRTTAFNVLIYVTYGAIYVTEDGTDYEVSAGELLFLRSGVHHWGNQEIKKGTQWYYFHFYDNDLKPEDMQFEFERKTTLPKKLSGLQGSRLEHMIKKYVESFYASDAMTLWNCNLKLFEILTEIAFLNGSGSKPQSLSDKISEYLTAHYAESFSTVKLEREFYLSYKYMAAVFKREQGMTMQQRHTSIRMNNACRLLRSTLMSVSEVSAAVGYNDALYFSRCFRTAVGLCPSAYRRAVLEGSR